MRTIEGAFNSSKGHLTALSFKHNPQKEAFSGSTIVGAFPVPDEQCR
jgi:hypothetical protein